MGYVLPPFNPFDPRVTDAQLAAWIERRERHRARVAAVVGPLVVIALVLAILAAVAPKAACQPAPSASPSPAPTTWAASFETGTSILLTRGEKRDRVAARLTIGGPITSSLGAFVRADLAGSQDGGSIEYSDPSTFRSVEMMGVLRYRIRPSIELGAVGGFTWSAEGEEGAPLDPRLFTVGAVVRGQLDERGSYAYLGAGHHGPVGGPALLGSVSWWPDARAGTAIDFAVPFRADAFVGKAWTLTVRALVRVKRLEF